MTNSISHFKIILVRTNFQTNIIQSNLHGILFLLHFCLGYKILQYICILTGSSVITLKVRRIYVKLRIPATILLLMNGLRVFFPWNIKCGLLIGVTNFEYN